MILEGLLDEILLLHTELRGCFLYTLPLMRFQRVQTFPFFREHWSFLSNLIN